MENQEKFLKDIALWLEDRYGLKAKLGENCEGFDESTGKAFPKCADGLVCEVAFEVSIPGAEKTCGPIFGPGPVILDPNTLEPVQP